LTVKSVKAYNLFSVVLLYSDNFALKVPYNVEWYLITTQQSNGETDFRLILIQPVISLFYSCISGKRERRRHNKKVYMVIMILSAAGKKAF